MNILESSIHWDNKRNAVIAHVWKNGHDRYIIKIDEGLISAKLGLVKYGHNQLCDLVKNDPAPIEANADMLLQHYVSSNKTVPPEDYEFNITTVG